MKKEKFESTLDQKVEKIESPESQETQNSPEELKQQITQASEREVFDFEATGEESLQSAQRRAEAEGLQIDEISKQVLNDLNNEAVDAARILRKELEILEIKRERTNGIAEELEIKAGKYRTSFSHKLRQFFSDDQLMEDQLASAARTQAGEFETQIKLKKFALGPDGLEAPIVERSDEMMISRIGDYIDQVTSSNDYEKSLSLQEQETENKLLGEYTQKLLKISEDNAENHPELRRQAERLLLQVYNSAKYVNPDESNPGLRIIDGIYKDSMKHMYQALSYQTLLRAGIKKRSKSEPESDYANDPRKADTANYFLKSILESYNLSSEEIIKNWRKSGYDSSLDGIDVMARDSLMNLERIRSLERMRPGITNSLNKEFGINLFGRYSEDVLVKQFDEKDNNDKPYGIMLNGYDDHNGIFMGFGREIHDFSSQLKETCNLRISEVDGKQDMAKRLAAFDARYGEGQKISFAIVSGHGTKDSLQFGKDVWWKRLLRKAQDGVFESRDFEWIKGMKKYFSESPWFIFNSCSTGIKEGIAQNTAEAIEGSSIGPQANTAGFLYNVSPVFEGNKLAGFEKTRDHAAIYKSNEKKVSIMEKPSIQEEVDRRVVEHDMTQEKALSISEAVVFLRNQRFNPEKEVFDFKISQEIRLDDLKELLNLSYETVLTEKDGQLFLSTGSSNLGIHQETVAADRMMHSKLSLHVHNLEEEKLSADTLSFQDAYQTEYLDRNTTLLLVCGKSIILYQKPFIDPTTGDETDMEARDIILKFAVQKGINVFGMRRYDHLRSWKGVSDEEKLSIQREFMEKSGMVIREVPWEDADAIESMMVRVNKHRKISEIHKEKDTDKVLRDEYSQVA